MAATGSREKVTFITPGAQLSIRLTEHSTAAICKAARDLRARYFIAVDGWDNMRACPIWGVFDMRTAQKDDPTPGAWSIRDPIKKFSTESPDPAVMWALAKGDR